MAAETLRDLSKPIDVPLLDAAVPAFYGTGSKGEGLKIRDNEARPLRSGKDKLSELQIVDYISRAGKVAVPSGIRIILIQ